MKFSTHGLVIGGRAQREAKCLIASRIRERMAADSQPLPAVYIWSYATRTSPSRSTWPTPTAPRSPMPRHAGERPLRLLVVDNASPETFHLYPMATAWSEAEAQWLQAQWLQAFASPSVVAWAANGANDGTTADGTYDHEGDEPLASMRFILGHGHGALRRRRGAQRVGP